ncbi:MAG: DUF3244 domain-containing protein [Synergistaceae bacterium]|nr:DUF3244 domain-containing protein [Synergistaceae bacterium]
MRTAQSRKFIASVCLAGALLLAVFAATSEAAKKTSRKAPPIPPYRASGSIPGTPLLYENLFISDSGRVTITIYNPENTGVNFSSNFSFYTEKGEFTTGFTLSGFASGRDRVSYALDMPNFADYKRAKNMKVLGRSGRTGA